MNRLSGYTWEITTSNADTRRVVTEGPNLEEAVSEYRRLHGYSEILFKVKYLPREGQKKNEPIRSNFV